MTPIDTQLFEFFMDLSNLESYAQDYPRLKVFYDQCCQHLENKAYSDINVQDQQGNTFLHYAIESGKLNWIEKLLNLKSDPTIVNNKQLGAFHLLNRGLVSKFWSQYENIVDLQKEFKVKTANYCQNFKQMVFSHIYKHKCLQFKSWENIVDFLNDNQLNTSSNRLKALCFSFIKTKAKTQIFLTNFNDPEDNSFFLKYGIGNNILNAHPERNSGIVVKEFLSRNFLQDDNFDNGVDDIFRSCEQRGDIDWLEEIFNIILEQKFDLNRPINHSQHTLGQDIDKYPIVKAIFYNKKLHFELKNKNDNFKKQKL